MSWLTHNPIDQGPHQIDPVTESAVRECFKRLSVGASPLREPIYFVLNDIRVTINNKSSNNINLLVRDWLLTYFGVLEGNSIGPKPYNILDHARECLNVIYEGLNCGNSTEEIRSQIQLRHGELDNDLSAMLRHRPEFQCSKPGGARGAAHI